MQQKNERKELLKFSLITMGVCGAILGAIPLVIAVSGKRLSDDGSLFTKKAPGRVAALGFIAPDRLLSASSAERYDESNDSLQWWDISTGKLQKELTAQGKYVRFSPDGSRYAGYMPDSKGKSTIGVWNTQSNALISQHVSQNVVMHSPWPPDMPNRLRFSPDGKWIAESTYIEKLVPLRRRWPLPSMYRPRIAFQTAEKWEVTTGKRNWLKVETDFCYTGNPQTHPLAVAPDGASLLETSGSDIDAPPSKIYSPSPSKIYFRDARTGKKGRVLYTSPGEVSSGAYRAWWHLLACSPDGSLVAAVSGTGQTFNAEGDNGTIFLIEVTTGKLKWKRYTPWANPTIINFSPDGKLLACGNITDYPGRTLGGDTTVWDVATGRLRRTLTRETTASKVSYSLQSTGRWLESYWRSVPTSRVPADRAFPVTALAFSPDSRLLAVGDEEGDIKIWKVGE
jgi:WD40 repeat protein